MLPILAQGLSFECSILVLHVGRHVRLISCVLVFRFFRTVSCCRMVLADASFSVHVSACNSFAICNSTGAVPGVMDRAALSGYTLEQLITLLLAIVIELCSRFRIPVPTATSAAPAAPSAPDLETPPPRFCGFHCRWCPKACGRSKPGHDNHSCYEHRHWRDG